MQNLQSHYQTSGDLVRIPQKTFLWEMDGWHHRLTDSVEYGIVIESHNESFYKILVGEEFRLVKKDEITWMGV